MPRTQGSARQEAERLVATVLAMAASPGPPRAGGWAALGDAVLGMVGQATGTPPGGHDTPGAHPPASDGPASDGPASDGPASDGPASDSSASDSPGAGWATGSAECCVCPVCRVIAGLRDPDPRTVERLATGAGDFAVGVASLLRSFSDATGSGPTGFDATGSGATGSGATGSGATVGPREGGDRWADDPWASATAAAHDPAATVPRASRPTPTATSGQTPTATAAQAPTAPAGRAPSAAGAGGLRPGDPWAAATAAPMNPPRDAAPVPPAEGAADRDDDAPSASTA